MQRGIAKKFCGASETRENVRNNSFLNCTDCVCFTKSTPELPEVCRAHSCVIAQAHSIMSRSLLSIECDAHYASVARAFENNYTRSRERGSQLVCSVNGEIVVNCNGGTSPKTYMKEEDTAMVFSCSKVVESLAVAILVDRGNIEYHEPVCRYWPAFRELDPNVTIACLMQHRARLGAIHELAPTVKVLREMVADPVSLESWVFRALRIDKTLDSSRESSYHAITRGILVDLLIYHVTGQRGYEFIQEHICDVVNSGYRLGTGNLDVKEPRRMHQTEPMESKARTVARLIKDPIAYPLARVFIGPRRARYWYMDRNEIRATWALLRSPKIRRCFRITQEIQFDADDYANHPEFHEIPLLSMTGVCSAMDLTLILKELANGGGKLISRAGMRLAVDEMSILKDAVSRQTEQFSSCGWGHGVRMGDIWYGWQGAGGSLAVFSPIQKATFVYIPTKLETRFYPSNAEHIRSMFEQLIMKLPDSSQRVFPLERSTPTRKTIKPGFGRPLRTPPASARGGGSFQDNDERLSSALDRLKALFSDDPEAAALLVSNFAHNLLQCESESRACACEKCTAKLILVDHVTMYDVLNKESNLLVIEDAFEHYGP